MARRKAAMIPNADGNLPAPVAEVAASDEVEGAEAAPTAIICMIIRDEHEFHPPLTYVDTVTTGDNVSFINHQFNAGQPARVPKHVAAASLERWPNQLRLANEAERSAVAVAEASA